MIVSGGSYYKIANGSIDSAGLPSEYQQVEYIENSGTQYINTNYIPNFENGFEISVEYTPKNSSSRGCLLSNYCATPYHISLEVRESFRQRFYYHNGTWDNNILGVKILNKRNIGIFKYINGVFYHTLNDTTQSYDYTSPGSCNEPLLMFVDTNKRFGIFTNYLKIYKCSIKDNNTLVRNFIPCYRISDNVIGMYDTVNGVFYTNQGTGTFVKGPNVYNRYTIKEFDRPYISGHVTDGSSAFTFKVNNQDVTVNVDSNGNFKYYPSSTVTSLESAFESLTNIDKVLLYGFKDIESGYKAFNSARNIQYLTFKNCDTSKLTDARLMFQNTGANYSNLLELILPKNFAPQNCTRLFSGYKPKNRIGIPKEVFKNATKISICFGSAKVDIIDYSMFYVKNYWYREGLNFNGTETPTLILGTINTNRKVDSNFFGSSIKNISFTGTYNVDMELDLCNELTKQSILNIINAAEASVTLTLHSTPYAKCASGGEWYTDVQAAINAKALEGYTVTLISA